MTRGTELIRPRASAARLCSGCRAVADARPDRCGVHIDHSILTALCPAQFLFHPSPCHSPSGALLPPLAIPSPSPQAGLYIKTRSGDTVKASIPYASLSCPKKKKG